MVFREGVVLGFRRGIGLEVVGIASALLVLLIWFGISAASYPREVGTSWSNFLNWARSPQGQIFGTVLITAMVLVLLLSATSMLNKGLRGARREALIDDEIGPLPENPEDEQK